MKKIFLIAFISITTISWSQTSNFSQEILSKFAEAYIEVRNENMNLQLNKLTAIEDAGLTSDEFTEIHISLKDPESKERLSVSKKRLYNIALRNIEDLQKNIQDDMQRIINKHGIELETYHKIAKASQTDKSLNQKIQKLINSSN